MRSWLAGAIIACVTLMGCAHRNRAAEESLDADSSLHVVNRHWGDVDIYVLHNGQRTRVGEVPAVSERTFVLRSAVIGTTGSARLEAHAVGLAGQFVSENFGLRSGLLLDWSLELDLARGSLAIY